MKKIILIITILTLTKFYAQKTYEFDYVIEYETTFYKDSIKTKNSHFRDHQKKIHRYYLTNSKNNDYFAIIIEKDSLNYRVMFIDYNGIYSDVIFSKSDLNNAEFINIKCENVSKYFNPQKYQSKNYDFFVLNDTVINNKSFSMYKFSSIKPKIEKRKKLGTDFFIINKSTDFHLPILTHSTEYEKWNLKKNIPNGIMKERYLINYFGKISQHEKLIKYEKTDKKIIVPKGCTDTEFIIR
ncbi:hypothetical protein [Lutibacter sp. B1]|uniref:hypothetical protein n=1 Tax=Lutibacter sp. B1 TaxID=2725996 RepID=UPI001456574F|nr:hypothetical protein [Lutibacter sp. B1]NLP59489.1 hypothetical protein [Lutibacter sp. B1]